MMLSQRAGILGLLSLLIMRFLACSAEAQTSAFLINCGANSSIKVDGREWVADTAPGKDVTLSNPPGIQASTTAFNGDPVYEPLYRTARIFTDILNYSFQVSNGDYFLRIHFYPLASSGYNVNESCFSVVANGFNLVSEFNVPGEISDKNLNLVRSAANSSYFYLLKEYFFSVGSNAIVVSFVPSKGSFGFVSAMEVIFVGNKMFTDSVGRVGGGNSSLNWSKRGIETMYRLNVGGSSIKPSQESFLWRSWEMDTSYMINADAGSGIVNSSNITYANPNDTAVAPLEVYETARYLTDAEVLDKRFNMSWKLEVDPGFDYLVRLHFCELFYDGPNQRVFRIFIDKKTATDNFDIFVRAGGMNKAYHDDYLDSISSNSNTIWIQLGPDPTTGSAGTDALLNGLEIFKLSRNGNLAYVQTYSNVKAKSSSRSLILWLGIGAGVSSIAILAAIYTMIMCFCKKKREGNNTKKSPPGWRPLFLHGSVLNSTANAKRPTSYQNQNGQFGSKRTGRHFTLAEIRVATNNFDESLLIGVGGFGKVYKGEIDESTLVAIKRANTQSQQSLTEFETEIEMLSKLRHRHLVSLIGFCDEQNEMILVYEYMANGTLRSHLFGSDLPPLSWKHRLEICIGAARGLHYLHTGSDQGIIHRDVKTTNILLDEKFVAKMADFGLSKTGPSLEHTHVSTAVKGSFGYLDPEYFRRQQLTEKSDIYSFGVVLFEVVCARPVINPTLPKDQINLAEWAMRSQRERSLERIIDPRLRENYYPESLIRFGDIAEKCLADEGKSRPTMGEVLWHLEYVLQLQEAWLRTNARDDSVATIQDPNSSVDEGESEGITTATNSNSVVQIKTKTDGRSASRTAGVLAIGVDDFSQMVDQEGR